MKIQIRNLSVHTKKSQLINLLGRFGHIASIQISKKNFLKYNRCFAYVTFQEMESGEKAIEELNGYVLNGKRIQLGQYQ